MTTRLFAFVSCALSGLVWAGLSQTEAMSPVGQSLWWPAGIGVVTGASLLSRWWVGRASQGSPMGFVAAVNGSTAIKMFSLLIVVSSFLVTHENGRVPYALGIFGVFVVQLVLFVWDVARLMKTQKKNS